MPLTFNVCFVLHQMHPKLNIFPENQPANFKITACSEIGLAYFKNTVRSEIGFVNFKTNVRPEEREARLEGHTNQNFLSFFQNDSAYNYNLDILSTYADAIN